MRWLKGNPLGIALVAVGGFLALLALGMAVVWNLPLSVNTDDTVTEDVSIDVSPLLVQKIGSLNDYGNVDQRPVFNESRRPEIVVVEAAPEDPVDQVIEVKDAPEVKLTGVIITPGMKIASLTPADKSQESVMAHEGQSLTGEFVGWQVTTVNPRDVVLKSNDGQQLALELQVHDVAIKQPPKPKPKPKPAASTAKTEQAAAAKNASKADDEEPLSRAEQIRQRIAERREELRREQEAQSNQGDGGGSRSQQEDRANSYQNAIQARMRNSRKDKDSNDEEE